MEQPKSRGLVGGAIALGVIGLLWMLIMGKAVFGLVFFLAGAGLYIRSLAAGQPPGAAPFWQQRSVLVVGFIGAVAALVALGFIPQIGSQHGYLTETEADIARVQHVLESAKYDSKGNVVGDSTEFYSALGASKVLPGSLQQARSQFYEAIAIVVVALIVFAGCLAFVLRASKRPPAAA